MSSCKGERLPVRVCMCVSVCVLVRMKIESSCVLILLNSNTVVKGRLWGGVFSSLGIDLDR